MHMRRAVKSQPPNVLYTIAFASLNRLYEIRALCKFSYNLCVAILPCVKINDDDDDDELNVLIYTRMRINKASYYIPSHTGSFVTITTRTINR